MRCAKIMADNFLLVLHPATCDDGNLLELSQVLSSFYCQVKRKMRKVIEGEALLNGIRMMSRCGTF